MSSNVTTSLDKLKLDDDSQSPRAQPADSWEDAAAESMDSADEEDGNKDRTTPIRPGTANPPAPPPPTPSSPTDARKRDLEYQNFGPLSYDSPATDRSSRSSEGPERRPEKTTAVASRLIAAGLGQRAPKRTPEQREYDQAMKVQEKKKRDQAKAEEERKQREAEAAKRAIWDD